MIVDTHLHPIADDTTKYPIAPLGGQQSAWSVGVHMTGDEIVEHIKHAGVDKVTLVQASTVHGYDNTYTAECVAKLPDYFVGVCCIDPQVPDAADTLSHWVKDKGLRGVRLFTTGSTLGESDWFDKPHLDPFWRMARDLGIPVNAQVRGGGLGMVRNVASRFPEIPLILDHMAGPKLEDGPPYEAAKSLFDMAEIPTIYLKFSTSGINESGKGKSTSQEFFQKLVDVFGPNRIMWGSNFPGTKGSAEEPYKDLADLLLNTLSFLSPEERDTITGGTAASLYPDLMK